MSGSGSESDDNPRDPELPQGARLPLNSKRLTAVHLRAIAKAMDLSTTGSTDQVRQMIEGKLQTDEARDISSTLVILTESPMISTVLSLVDSGGVFLETEATYRAQHGEHGLKTESSEATQKALEEVQQALGEAQHELEMALAKLAEQEHLVLELQAKLEASTSEEVVEGLKSDLKKEKERFHQAWKLNCEQVAEQDRILTAKEEEIKTLSQQLENLRGEMGEHATTSPTSPTSPPPPPPRSSERTAGAPPMGLPSREARRGKAPPIIPFSGESFDMQLDDWLPSLERASLWNGWSDGDKLLQLAGHLRGRALQEWNLLGSDDKITFSSAVEALQARLDPGSKTMAAQDFRHSAQLENESVADFIRRLEKTFQIAYGRDKLKTETRDTLLYGQLMEGLKYELVRGPSVSGAQTYKELCTAAKSEERRLVALKKRQQYDKLGRSNPAKVANPSSPSGSGSSGQPRRPTPAAQASTSAYRPSPVPETRRCHNCGEVGHLARNCRRPRTESSGRPMKPSSGLKQIQTDGPDGTLSSQPELTNVWDFLLSSSDEEPDVCTIRINDKGSMPQCVPVQLQGVPVYGVIDTGADITILGGNLFKKVATIAKLKKRDFRPADKTPRNYDQRPFQLDGRLDLDIGFGEHTLRTPVYVKMDAHDQLLLSEGVCRQLGIVSYHPSVERWRGGNRQGRLPQPAESQVPTVRVNLVQSVRLLPHQSKVVEVRMTPATNLDQPLLLEPLPAPFRNDVSLDTDTALLRTTAEGTTKIVVSNPTGQACRMEGGSLIGNASIVHVIDGGVPLVPEILPSGQPTVGRVQSQPEAWRKKRLADLVGRPELLTMEQTKELHSFLGQHHSAFCLEEQERGETDLVEMEIHTKDADPKKVPARRMPFAVRQEVARQLREMQQNGVIQPSSSPWASPVVMVRKKDGTHRFCIDYRDLNAVTVPDTFPLPRIDDLLDQLGQSRFFSTLDLASGYWQIRVHPDSRKKTAFVTPQGLFEFRVMPFGLTNAPSVFQRLMQKVLAGLNPENGPDFVVVYIDDILVFSRTLEEHLEHLRLVIERLEEAKLKLKPVKCQFIRKEVDYLGHVLTPEGLKVNTRLVESVANFPQPQNISEVRRFLGLASYYRRFVPQFSKIAQPLRALTCKGAAFLWNGETQAAMEQLKEKLTQAPVLAYPSFGKPFTLETDASVSGIGAVLSQEQDDSRLHPIAYASRSLSSAERNYSITELETLAVVWAVTHFHSYLYGHSVTILTDHTAVKAVLETPNPSGKHARWWTKVYGTGVRDIHIVYRSGRLNIAADVLSRSPQPEAPDEGVAEQEVQVAIVQAEPSTIQSLLQSTPFPFSQQSFALEQRKDPEVVEIVMFLEKGELPLDERRARRIALQASLFTLVEGVLFYIDPKQEHRKRVVVPRHLREQLLQENHSSPMGGHFAGKKMYGALVRHWWWDGMYSDTLRYARACPQCAIVSGGSKPSRPPLQPIPVSRLFQIVGVDVMELPRTEQGNRYVLVFQDFLSKWPLVFPMPDQKSIRIAQILVQEVVPLFGVPEALLSDRGTNLLSHLMQDICTLLGIKKLNTTAHHPECDGMVERFNRTLKTMLRKHASKYGNQWDRYLFGVVWAYRNTPHDSTGEKPSFLLFGTDCRTPSEAALLPPNPMENTSVEDYREEVIQTLSTARRLAADSIQNAQRRYKAAYDKKSSPVSYGLGDWVLVKFPQDETGRNRKLSRPWHGPYRIVERRDPDVTVVKVYAPQEGQIQVHQSRVSPCPPGFPAGFFWYGGKRSSPGRPPKWVDKLLQDANQAWDLVRDPPLLVDSDLQQYPPPSCQLETDSSKECAPKAPTNRAEDSVAMEAVLGAEIPARRQTKYGLRTRSKLTAPSRLMFLSSGRAPLEGRVM